MQELRKNWQKHDTDIKKIWNMTKTLSGTKKKTIRKVKNRNKELRVNAKDILDVQSNYYTTKFKGNKNENKNPL